jgi:toxin ParE1/3/4
MMRCIFAARAEADLEDIGDYIAEDNPLRARSFTIELRERCKRIADMPRAYPLRPEIASDIRALVMGNYVILYSAHADHVLIERIVHGARNIEELF